MVPVILASLATECATEKVSKYGTTSHYMRATGLMIGPMVVAALSTQMEMFTKESGKMTKPMDMEFTLVLINLITLDSGVMTFSMDMA